MVFYAKMSNSNDVEEFYEDSGSEFIPEEESRDNDDGSISSASDRDSAMNLR